MSEASELMTTLQAAENAESADDSLLEKTYAMEALLDRLIYEIDQLQRTYRFYITRGTGTSALRDHMMHLRGFALEARKILGKE